MALRVRHLDSTPNPSTICCHCDLIAQCPCVSLVLLIKTDCSFLLYPTKTKRPNSSSLRMTEIPGWKLLCWDKIYYYGLLQNKRKMILIVCCLSNQFLARIQIKITAFHVIYQRRLVAAWKKNTLENSSTVIYRENTSALAFLSFLFSSGFLPHVPLR